MTRVYVGLGANLGDAHAALSYALQALRGCAADGEVACSRWYRSAPIDATGPDFLNAVAAFDTRLGAPQLLAELHRIEAAQGRERPYRHAPRTLDLDLLLYGDEVITTDGLVVPHPRLHERAFVLLPLAELAPDLKIPERGALRDLLPGVQDQRLTLANGPALSG